MVLAVRRAAVLVVPEGERPHPGLPHRHCRRLHDPADDNAIGGHVEVIASFHSPEEREADARV
jgi:hypothetical protein